jgi:flagellar biosynthesis/type III secretory pathway protein FliH
MRTSTRPYLPPSINLLLAGEDGSAALRRQEEERMRNAAFDAGHRRGIEEGLAQGHAEGAAQAEAAASQRLEAEVAQRASQGASLAARALETLLSTRAQDRRSLDADTRATLVAALEAIAPTLLAQAAGAEIAALVAEALTERGEDIILLTAHPDTLEAMREEGFPQPQEAPSRLRLLPEPTMPPGSAEASWVSGGLIHRPDALLARVLAILDASRATHAPSETLQEITP